MDGDKMAKDLVNENREKAKIKMDLMKKIETLTNKIG